MVLLAVFSLLAVLMTTGVECGYTSAGSSSSSSSDGSGHQFTQSTNNGQGQFMYTQNKPGGVGITTAGSIPPYPSQGPFYGPGNFGQPAYGLNYGPSFPYNPYGSMPPPYQPYPQPQPPAFGFNPPFQPFQPFTPYQPFQQISSPLATPQEFGAYLNTLQQQYNTGGSFAQTTPGATAFATSYLGPTKYYKQQQELLNAWKNTPPFVAGYSGVPNYAYATGVYGPQGIQQTAGVFPPNKNNPNVDNRIDPSDAMANNVPGGYFGVQTASFSSSSDVNGKKMHKEGATTTVNDNGKVTTYKVEN